LRCKTGFFDTFDCRDHAVRGRWSIAGRTADASNVAKTLQVADFRDAILLTEAEAVGMTLQPAALIVDDGHGRTT